MRTHPFHLLRQTSFTFRGMKVNAYEGGTGTPLVVVHGSGPGASSIGNWRLVLDRLAVRHRVLAIDLIGFGESDRKPAFPFFDVALWVDQIRAAIDYMEAPAVGLVGHSLAGALVLKVAARDPRVDAVLTTGTMGAPMPVNPALDYVWRCPTSREEMRTAATNLMADHSLITEAYLDYRMAVIGSKEYQTYFDTMFSAPFGDIIEAVVLDDAELARIEVPVLMLHGRNDLPIPAETGSVALLPKLARGDLLLLHGCGHSIAMERTASFLAAVDGHFCQ
jgi:2-hydroxymuconate-semialdehyde hydrolase